MQRTQLKTTSLGASGEDLHGFVGSLFDHLVASPKLMRLGKWRQLEGVESSAAETEWSCDMVGAIVQAQKRGVITADIEPADLLTLLLGMTTSWFYLSFAMSDLAIEEARSPQRLQQSRTALTTAACRLLAPSPHVQPHGAGAERSISGRRGRTGPDR
jgi:hypothetical protein